MLTTARLRLRPMDGTDLAALTSILGDPVTMTAYEGAFDADEIDTWLVRQQQRYRDDGFGLWAVEHDGAMIGQAGITRQRIEDDEVLEVGYLFRRDQWHRGFATEAASACRDWAFRELAASEVWAKVRTTNIGSMNVAIRLGMRARRTFITHYRGVDMPHIGFAVSRAEWEALLTPRVASHAQAVSLPPQQSAQDQSVSPASDPPAANR